jgi:hypothetical protein
VYITAGTAGGGEAGSTDKIGSTWTQPPHQHWSTPHVHGISSHTHTFSDSTDIVTSILQYVKTGSGDAAWVDHGHTFSGTTTSNGGGTGASDPDQSGLNTTPNTWRPKGRNFTRQQRT